MNFQEPVRMDDIANIVAIIRGQTDALTLAICAIISESKEKTDILEFLKQGTEKFSNMKEEQHPMYEEAFRKIIDHLLSIQK